jgi:class 3 adenylate cyclase/tetratricopeptide (TPR) repeat protein
MSSDPCLPYVSRLPLSWPDADGPVAHWVEGTLLFVDVAGFTALSERLARTGRAGAEELTDLLNGAFARLLAAAYENGGSLLSFGGDALLLMFEGSDHPRRAAHAAAVMRRKPSELGALQTTVGPVRLKVSMGAHSGRFLFLVAGDDSRVVLVLGPDATATVRLEQRAKGGEVMLGPALAAAVPEAAGPVEDGAALLVRRPRPPLVGDPHPPGEPVTPASRFLSPPLRVHINGQPTSEHRRVAVGFLQLRGVDALLAADATAATQAVHDVVTATQRAAAEYGVCLIGSDIDGDGAKLILVAGAPLAGEHEEDRMLRTMRAALDLPTPLQLRAGVTAGPVFVGDVGPSYRRAFTTMGDRVNLAARLMASAAPGELRTLPSVVAASTTTFLTTPLEPLQLKGIAEPVPAVALGKAIGQARSGTSGALFGREAELATLGRAIDEARAGRGGTVEVVGEAGVGKTALLAAALEGAQVPALRANAVPYETETSLGLIRRVVRHLLGIDAEAHPEDVGRVVTDRLGALAPTDLALVLMAAHATSASVDVAPVVQDDLLVRRLARALLQALPVLVPGTGVLVVEDVQWADPTSAELLAMIGDHLDDTSYLLCLSRRGGTGWKPLTPRGTTIQLEPLDPASATELVESLTSAAPVATHLVATLVDRSGGNPLFLHELVRLGRDSDDLPESVEAVVHARLDALPPYLRKMLRQAAVLGPHFDLDLLREVAGFVPDREEWRMLDGLLRRAGSRAEFTSEMYRDVAYSSLPFRERRALHAAVGRLLDAQGSNDVELLALHAAQAHDNELTWRYSVEAARRSMARGAHEQAVTALRRALIAYEKGELGAASATWDVHRLLGDALLRAGRGREACQSFSRARRLCPRGVHGDPALCQREGWTRLLLGDLAAAKRWMRRGLAAVEGEDDRPARLELLRGLAGTCFRQGRFEQALRTASELVDLTEDTPDRAANAHAHALMHSILVSAGDPRCAEHRTQAIAIYTELGDLAGMAKAYNNLGTDAYYSCRWDDAIALYEKSRECEVKDANDVGASISDANIAEVLSDQGHFEQAHLRLQRALRTARAEDYQQGVVDDLLHLGRLETRRGDAAAATAYFAEAHALNLSMGGDLMEPDRLVREVELALLLDHADEAAALLALFDAAGNASVEARGAAEHLRGAVAARRGDLAEARRLLEALADAPTEGQVYRVALASHTLSVLLGTEHEGAARRAAAYQQLRELGVVRFWDPLAATVVDVPGAPGVVDLDAEREHLAV